MTIRAALLTPPGTSALATIQIAGDESLNILDKIFRPHREIPDESILSSSLTYGAIYEADEIIDKAVVAVDPGRLTVDINCHGGQRIVQRIMLLLQKLGVEITTWRQIPTVNSLAEEVAITLPVAKTRTAVRALAAQYPTGLTGWCRLAINKLQKRTLTPTEVKTEANILLGTYRLARKLLSEPVVVIAGAVNVGKSTLANALTGKSQSIAAEVPGTTRDWTEQLTDMAGLGVNLIDTAGRRDTSDDIEQQALEYTDRQIAKADLILLVVEEKHIAQKLIDSYLNELPDTADVIIVVNKIDLQEPKTKIKNYLYISALKETNLDQLRCAVAARFGFADFDPMAPLVFTERQFQIVTELMNAVDIDNLIEKLRELLGS